MKVSILITLIVLPMLVSIGLYCYALISTQWSTIDNDLISKYDLKNKKRESLQLNLNHTFQLETQYRRYIFRRHYGLFGYCLESKWLNLLTIKSSKDLQINSSLNSVQCQQSSEVFCRELGHCVKKCDYIVDCPSYTDEEACIRHHAQARYYWKEEKCIWHSLLSDIQGIPRWLLSNISTSNNLYNMKTIRYYLMIILFLLSPIFIFFGLLILICLNCTDRFYSIPFAFVSFFSLISFLTGLAGLGLFLYEWIDERLYQLNSSNEYEPSIVALNPWIMNVEHFSLAFWLLLAAIGTNLLITIISFCLCCGLQSEKSKLRIYVNNDKYAIVHTGLYDE